MAFDPSEGMLARWLTERSYPFTFEPDWGVRTRPDFRVSHPAGIVAIEVKSIESWGLFTDVKPGVTISRPMSKALKPVRDQIREAAKQLKPLAGSGIALVVAIANPHRRPVPFSADMVISAMYGDPSYQFGEHGEGGRAVLGRNGKLRNDHRHLSAVMVLRESSNVRKAASAWFDEHRREFDSAASFAAEVRRLDAEGRFGRVSVAVDLIDTVGDSARVPDGFPSGPDDTRWSPTPDGVSITRIR